MRPISLSLLALLFLAGCGENPNVPTFQGSAGGSNKYTYGTKISFAQAGNAGPFKTNGWSKPEEQFTWTEGKAAVLTVSVPPTDGQITLRMNVAGMIKEPEFPTHPVEVFVNDQKIANWEVGNTAPFSAPIPQELTKNGGNLTFTFKMPKATSPKELGKSEDPRLLGICVFDLELTQG